MRGLRSRVELKMLKPRGVGLPASYAARRTRNLDDFLSPATPIGATVAPSDALRMPLQATFRAQRTAVLLSLYIVHRTVRHSSTNYKHFRYMNKNLSDANKHNNAFFALSFR